jgi:hypothetical protein
LHSSQGDPGSVFPRRAADQTYGIQPRSGATVNTHRDLAGRTNLRSADKSADTCATRAIEDCGGERSRGLRGYRLATIKVNC